MTDASIRAARECLAGVGDADFAASVLHGPETDVRMSFNGRTVILAMLTYAEQVREEERRRIVQIMRDAAAEHRSKGFHYGAEPKGWPKTQSRAWAHAEHGKHDVLIRWADAFEAGWHMASALPRPSPPLPAPPAIAEMKGAGG